MLALGLLRDDDVTVSHTGAGLVGRGVRLGADLFGPRRRSLSQSRAPGRTARADRTRAHTEARAGPTHARTSAALAARAPGPAPSRRSLPPPPRMPAAAPLCSAAAPGAGRPAPASRLEEAHARTLALLTASLLARAQRGWEGRSPCSQSQPAT